MYQKPSGRAYLNVNRVATPVHSSFACSIILHFFELWLGLMTSMSGYPISFALLSSIVSHFFMKRVLALPAKPTCCLFHLFNGHGRRGHQFWWNWECWQLYWLPPSILWRFSDRTNGIIAWGNRNACI